MFATIAMFLFILCFYTKSASANTKMTKTRNVAKGKKYRYITYEPKNYYTDPRNNKLTDGKHSFDWADHVGWNNVREQIVIDLDLGKVREDVVGATTYALMATKQSVGLPKRVDVSISLDGEDFCLLGEAVRNPREEIDSHIYAYEISCEPLPLRYVRFTVTPNAHADWCMLSQLEVKGSDICKLSPHSPSDFASFPEVLKLSGDVAEVAWSTLETTKCQISVHETGKKVVRTVTLPQTTNHHFQLTDLTPNTSYILKVTAGNSMRSLTFTTDKLAIERGPILGISAQEELQVSFEANALVEALLEYWPSENKATTNEVKFSARRYADAVHYSVSVPAIKLDRSYGYRIKLLNKEVFLFSQGFEFRNLNPLKNETFTFLVYGDTQHAASQKSITKEMLKVEAFDFVLHVGDLVNQAWNILDWEALFKYSGPLMAKAYFFPTLGNHDNHHDLYYQCFDLPNPKDYYAVNFGPLLIICIDTSQGLSLNPEQLEWLEKKLASSKQKIKLVFTHYPFYVSYLDYDIPGADALGELFTKYGVKAVFSGHTHIYDHVEKGCVHYFISGGSGGYQVDNPSTFDSTLSFLKVSVTEKSLIVEAIKLGGEIKDSCVIEI